MAIGRFNYYSRALRGLTEFQVIIPNDLREEADLTTVHYQRGMKTLILLHGYTGIGLDWVMRGNVADIADKYNLCIIMPNGGNNFYLDREPTGQKYATFVGEELLEYARKTFGLSDRYEDTYIGGFSMGGFGAIHVGLQFNHTFSKIIGLSSAMIIHDYEKLLPEESTDIANYDYYQMIFGDNDKLGTSLYNPEYQVKKIREEKDILPEIYLTCGTEDHLIEHNRDFRDFLLQHGVKTKYVEESGVHDFEFWNRQLAASMSWLLKTED